MSETQSTYFPRNLGSTPIDLSYAEAQNLIDIEAVKKGQLYRINNMADVGVILTGIDSTHYSTEGIAGFYNADFHGVGDYSDIGPTITPKGIWRAADEGSYADNDAVIWNNLQYRIGEIGNVNGSNPANNGSAYYLLDKNNQIAGDKFGYILEYDKVIFDFATGLIMWRMDKRGNKIPLTSFATWDWGNDRCRNYVVGDFGSSTNALNMYGYLTGSQNGEGSAVQVQEGNGAFRLYLEGGVSFISYEQFSSGIQEVYAKGNCNIIGRQNDGTVTIKVFNSDIDYRGNTGIISAIFENGCDIFLQNNVRSLTNCIFSSINADLQFLPQDYDGKVLSPHLSTFNVEIMFNTSGAMSIPEYVGIIKVLNGSIGDNICTGFDNNTSFPRRITVSAGSDTAITFDNSADFILPTPSTSTTIGANDMDYIEFLYNSFTTATVQIASEKYA